MKKILSIRLFWPALFLVAICQASVLSQQQAAPIAPVSSSCNNEAAVEFIQQYLAESKTFDDNAQRIGVLIRGADLLWPYQEEKSRAAFDEAFELAIQNFKEKGADPQREGRGLLVSVPDMRYTVIGSIAKRDFAWAKKLAEQLLEDQLAEAKEKGQRDSAQETRTAERLLSMANSLLTLDQAAALSFARQSLRLPATMNLSMFLYALAGQNRAAADEFYATALAAYANAPMERFLYLSSYPFGNDREAGEMPGYTIYKVPDGFTPNPNLQRLLVQTLLGRVQQEIARPSDPVRGRLTEPEQMLLALRRLESQIGQTMPNLAPTVEQAKLNLIGHLPENSQKNILDIISRQNQPRGSFAEQVEAAEKNPNVDRRDQALASAVIGAPASEDLDLVLGVVNKISDAAMRAQLLNWLYFTRTQGAIKEKQLVQARRLAAKVDELDQRGFLYFRIAEESLKQNIEQTQARELLEEVVEAVAKAPSSMVSARTQLGVAHLYTKFEATRAIAVLADAVKTINKLESPDFARQFTIRRIEGKTFGMYASFHTPGFNPEDALREISKTDFDGTLYQASNFASKPLRVLTTLAVVEPCLKVAKQPVPGKKPGKVRSTR